MHARTHARTHARAHTHGILTQELQVLDIQFLYGFQNPTIVILFQDPKEMRHVKTYEISIKDKVSCYLSLPPPPLSSGHKRSLLYPT